MRERFKKLIMVQQHRSNIITDIFEPFMIFPGYTIYTPWYIQMERESERLLSSFIGDMINA